MQFVERAIETTGVIGAKNQLILDEPLSIIDSDRVRVIILLPEKSDMNEREWLKAASCNSSFDFLKDSEEDIYTLADGRPFYA